VKIEEKRGRGGLRAGEGKTAAGLGQGCLAKARVRGGGPVLEKLAQGQHLIIKTHFSLFKSYSNSNTNWNLDQIRTSHDF
jgi:hypothetical protein